MGTMKEVSNNLSEFLSFLWATNGDPINPMKIRRWRVNYSICPIIKRGFCL